MESRNRRMGFLLLGIVLLSILHVFGTLWEFAIGTAISEEITLPIWLGISVLFVVGLRGYDESCKEGASVLQNQERNKESKFINE